MTGRLRLKVPDEAVLDMLNRGGGEGLVSLYRLCRGAVTSYLLNNSGTPDDAGIDIAAENRGRLKDRLTRRPAAAGQGVLLRGGQERRTQDEREGEMKEEVHCRVRRKGTESPADGCHRFVKSRSPGRTGSPRWAP